MHCEYCGSETTKVIYFGLPGRLCENAECSLLTGLAAWVPRWLSVACAGPDGFAFMAYEGGYWPALWYWLTGGGGDDRYDGGWA